MVQVAFGQQPPGARSGFAAPSVPTAEGDGVIVASPADRTLFFYTEGMMAPSAPFGNYGREPRAVLLLDRSLAEVQPGVFQARIERPAAASYDVSLLLDQPRIPICLTYGMPFEAAPASSAPKFALEPAFDPALPLVAGEEARLRFRIGGGSDVDADDVAVLAFQPPGTWQWRGSPRKLRDGSFELRLPGPPAGRIRIQIAIPSREAPFGAIAPLELPVIASEN